MVFFDVQRVQQGTVNNITNKRRWHLTRPSVNSISILHDDLFDPQAAKKAKESFEAAGDKSGVALLGYLNTCWLDGFFCFRLQTWEIWGRCIYIYTIFNWLLQWFSRNHRKHIATWRVFITCWCCQLVKKTLAFLRCHASPPRRSFGIDYYGQGTTRPGNFQKESDGYSGCYFLEWCH